MNERRSARCFGMSVRDRQMLVAAYSPVIAFAAVLIATRIWCTRRHRLLAVL